MWKFLILILNLVVTITYGWYADLSLPYPDSILTNTHVEYVYYPDKIPWSAARDVCESLGGDLAKIDSTEQLEEMIWLSELNYGGDIFNEEYWVGLVEFEEDHHYWVSDCSNLTYTSKFQAHAFDSSKSCFRLRKDHTSERRDCKSKEGIMCQIASGQPCLYFDSFNTEVLYVGFNMSSCEAKCSSDRRCWGTMEHIPDSCVTLGLPGYGAPSLDLKTKLCSNFTRNETVFSTNLAAFVIEDFPNGTCGSLNISATPSSSMVASVDLQTYEPVNITHNVTWTTTELSTVYSNVSFTVTQQLTSHHTTTENLTITSTEISTTTSVSISSTTTTSVNTEYVYVNLTDTVTSMVHFTATRNLTTDEAEEIAQEIVKNLTIDTKSTSSHLRKLSSAEDSRQSAKFIGFVGVIFVVVPLGLMLLSDVRKVYLDCRFHEHIYKQK